MWAPGGQVRVVFDFIISGGKIVAIEMIADPGHLAQLEVVPAVILEELPLDVVRVAEGDHRVLARPVPVQVGGHVRGSQGLGQPVHLLAGPAERDVVQADPELGEPVSARGARERRAQHQSGAGARHPQPELLARKVLVDAEA